MSDTKPSPDQSGSTGSTRVGEEREWMERSARGGAVWAVRRRRNRDG
jgi:hypothetical protein